LPLLILTDSWLDHGQRWVDVVPLATDSENASTLDWLLERSDTDVGVPWRAILRYQQIVERQALDSCFGTLSAQGIAALHDVLEGDASEERFGSLTATDVVSHPLFPEGLDAVIKNLGAPYARLQEEATNPEGFQVVYEMKCYMQPRRATEGLSLAAQSFAPFDVPRWKVDIPQQGRLEGRIEHRYTDDELFFVVEDIVHAGLNPQLIVWIIAWSNRLSAPIKSQPFVPAIGERVSLARGQGIFPVEVQRLELSFANDP
jgi:hypothetical protein